MCTKSESELPLATVQVIFSEIFHHKPSDLADAFLKVTAGLDSHAEVSRELKALAEHLQEYQSAVENYGVKI